MQKYDITLKLLLQSHAKLTMLELAGGTVEKWLNVELPKVQNPRADLLGETADGSLVHVELQSGNEPAMPLRMAEYCLGVFRLFGKFPRQAVLYVGQAQLAMESELRGPECVVPASQDRCPRSRWRPSARKPGNGDNVIAILARLRNHKAAVRKIVAGSKICRQPNGMPL
jgi:hypothetical protein